MKPSKQVLMLGVLALTSCSAPPPAPPAAEENLYPYRVEQLAPRVHLLTQGNDLHVQPRGNVGVIEQRSGVVLVDSGGSPAAAEEVIAFVRSRTSKPVTWILLTHWHGDHVLGVSRLLEEWPKARVIATRQTREMLEDPASDRFMPGDDPAANAKFHENVAGGVDFLKRQSEDTKLPEPVRTGYAQAARELVQFGREMRAARRVAPNFPFPHLILLPDDESPVDLRFFGRANTAGDAIAWLPRQRVVFTGDVVVAPIPYGFNTYPTEWVAVLKQILALDFAVVAPGHGSAMRDTKYLERLIDMLTDVRTQVDLLTHTNVDAAGAAERVNQDAARKALIGDDPWMEIWFKNYWHTPIVSSALREARGEEIKQGAN
jgi:glyoxylase-like metal-dependent hydrolase (beta-lactamase superfamily II)